MNPEVGSIMGFFYKLFPVKIYELEVPENFEIPAMYFPPPQTFDGNDTNQTYLKTYNLSVKLFHHDSKQAHSKAEFIADAINSNRNVIPLLNEEGAKTGDYMRISRVETRVADSGVATINLTWDSRYYYEKEKAKSLGFVDFKSGVK